VVNVASVFGHHPMPFPNASLFRKGDPLLERAKNATKTTATRQPKWLRTMDKGNQPGSQERQPEEQPEGQARLPIPENNQKGNEKGGQQGSQKSD
jgi:hypothetical protein